MDKVINLDKTQLLPIDFKDVLVNLLDGNTLFVEVDDKYLAIKFDKGKLVGGAVWSDLKLDQHLYPINITLEELMKSKDDNWYCYLSYKVLQGV